MPRPFVSTVCATAALAALTAASARAEVADPSDTSFRVELTADAEASPAETWKVLIAPARWWSGEHTYSGDAGNLYLDAQATGCFCEKLPLPANAPAGQRMGSVEHMHVIQANPQAGLLRMSGALGPLQSEAVTGVLTVLLKPKGKGTRIEWVYAVSGAMRFKPAEIAAAVDKVLGEQIASLAAQATQSVAPAVDRPPAAKP